MTTTRNEVDWVIGSNLTLALTVRRKNRSPVDLTGATVHWRMKRSTSDTSDLVAKSSAVATEIVITSALKGKAQVFLLPADNIGLEPGTYVYDSWVVTAADAKLSVVTPTPINLVQPVTTGL